MEDEEQAGEQLGGDLRLKRRRGIDIDIDRSTKHEARERE